MLKQWIARKKREKEIEKQLRDVCGKMMELEMARIKEEMKDVEPHVFFKDSESRKRK